MSSSANAFAPADLDDPQRSVARIGEPVVRAARHTQRLPRLQRHSLAAELDRCRTLDHDPGLVAARVILQRQLLADIDDDFLDLEAGAGVQDGELPPGSNFARVRLCLAAAAGAQRRHQLLDRFRAVLVGDQNGVRGLDHSEIVNARQRNQPMLGFDEIVAGIVQHGIALDGVAGGVLGHQLPKGAPRADIGPAGIARHHGDALRTFHHGLVDRQRSQGLV